MPNDELLNSEQCIQFDHAILHTGCTSRAGEVRREIEHAVVAALAARGEVDVEALVDLLIVSTCEHLSTMRTAGDVDEQQQNECHICLADAIRLALAQQAVRCLDTQWDGTDAACPAWWRGQDDGCRGMEAKLQQRIADLEAGTALAKLRAELGDANRGIAEFIKDSVRLDTLEKWAERSNLTGDGLAVLRIAWPASSTLRETADAIHATMDAAKGEK